MGAHIHELKGILPLEVIMQTSAWRDTGVIPLPLHGRLSFFQNESAIVRGWYETDVLITHGISIVTVELPNKILKIGGIDRSQRSIQKFLNIKEQRNLRGVRLWFTATETDTWHYSPEE